MKRHQFRITVEHLCDPQGNSATEAPLAFQHNSHDNILDLVSKLQHSGKFEADAAASLAVGLKLFGDVMLENPDNPVFGDFKDAFGDFMRGLKQSMKS